VSTYGGRRMPIPLDRSVIGRRLLLPETLVLEANKLLRSYGHGEPHEGVVYLAGVEATEESVALLAIAPTATTTWG